MPIVRLLILVCIIWLLYRLVRRLFTSKSAVTDQSGSTHMVKCAQCGVYVANDDAYEKGNMFFCCQDHFRKYQEEHTG